MHTRWMHRCLELATLGAGEVAPNPMVGAVLVQRDRILAEGWHRAHGGPHAEVHCLNAWSGAVPEDATLYVNLEPCAHHGRTPPCADLIVERGVRKVVVGMQDPFPAVAGKGIERLRAAGVEVKVGILEQDCRWLNRRFLTSVELGRPYIILKWARSVDGYLDRHPRTAQEVQRISSPATDVLVHLWRAEEQAILVGSRTVINDDPQLTVRHVTGRQPLRVVIDRTGTTPATSRVYDASAPTLLFTSAPRVDVACEQVLIGEGQDVLPIVLAELHQRQVRSLLVEGGATMLNAFLAQGTWDEARVIEGTVHFGAGTIAPQPPAKPRAVTDHDRDRIALYVHDRLIPDDSTTPSITWPW
jgi:diaminohydroxyphosphoribosylaminopyrimidine deaminase/5-amino-6-(5-phosphoribosylamino)uracil reductase